MPEANEIYEQYRDLVYLFLHRLCRNLDLAEELTQDTFYEAVRQWKDYRKEASISSWLCAIAKRRYYSAMRKQTVLPLEDAPGIAAMDFTDVLSDHDMAMTAQRMLHQLSEPYREVFTLRTFCDLSHGQIGDLFGKSDSWARVTYYRAKVMLTEFMKGAEENET